MRFALVLIALLWPALTVHARPITYPGGWTVMTMNDNDSNALHLFYTVTPRYSVGINHEYLRNSGAHLDAAQLNYLVKRWNAPDSQANLYFKTGAGLSNKSGEYDAAAYAGIAADWENRRLYTSYANRFLWSGNADDFIKHQARVGIAPYVGDYGDLHSWLMLQADYDAGAKDSFSLTPLVRFFKGPALLEAGYNLDNGLLLNVMIAF